MTNLVLTMINGEPTVTSRQVAEDFGRRHVEVLDSIREILRVEKSTLKLFFETTYSSRGKDFPEFIMNKAGFSLLVMSFNNTTDVLQWKIKYIHAFEEMEKQLSTPKLPQTFLEALECMVTKEKALLVAAPKAEYYDKLCDRGHLSNFRDTAKAIGVGQKFFMEYLESHGYIYRDGRGKPRPYASAMDYFEMKDYTGRSTGTQCLITVAGKHYFGKEIGVIN